jgi:hypothetical protein
VRGDLAPGSGSTGRPLQWWLPAGAVISGTTAWAMFREVSTFGQKADVETGLDFANNTWRALRGLAAGQDVYAADAWMPGIGHVVPVAEHVPATLTWEAPFVALPLGPALFAFTLASLLAIWAGVLILTQPRAPQDVLLVACCGALAILAGGGPWTLLLGQPAGFILLGLAMVVRARRAWVAALGLMLAASTIQFGLPFALALLVLRRWPIVWRGGVMTAALSVPPVALGALRAGALPFAGKYASGGADFLGRTSNRIDLGALLHRDGIQSTTALVVVGAAVLGAELFFLGRLPASQRRIEYRPVMFLVIAVTLLCTYHQNYDMLIVAGAIVPMALAGPRSVAMFPIFGLAGISAALPGKSVAVVIDPLCLLAIAVLSALAARRASASDAADPPCSIGSEVTPVKLPNPFLPITRHVV